MNSLPVKAVALIAAGTGLYWALEYLSGVWIWLALTLSPILLLAGVLALAWNFSPAIRQCRGVAQNALVVVLSIGLLFTLLELFFPLYESALMPAASEIADTNVTSAAVPAPDSAWIEPSIDPDVYTVISARGTPLTMPEDWKQRHVEVPGTDKAYYWHGVLHVRDENRFRRSTPFPAKAEGTFRIMIVGDSLTYGMGIDERWTYPSVLERRLKQGFNIEVINLGVSGYNSEDILAVIKTWQPILDPELIIYGVCLNDFLPSNVNQQVYDTAYSLPLPRGISDPVTGQTRLGAFLSDRYDALLRKWDLRMDFYDGIFADIEGYQARFSSDVKDMASFVESQGLPPIVGMVLHQDPQYNDRGHQLSNIAEEAMQSAEFNLVKTESYFRRYHNQNLGVSPWEGHPNEEANQIFSSMLEDRISQQPALALFRSDRGLESTP